MRTRQERRDLTDRKWHSRLHKIFGDPFWNWVNERGKMVCINEYSDLRDSTIGRKMKNTGTFEHNFRVFSSPYNKDFRKRDISNKQIPKEQMEEADDAMDLCSFEKYCVNCDRFETNECPFRGKAFEATEWKKIGCKSFCD